MPDRPRSLVLLLFVLALGCGGGEGGAGGPGTAAPAGSVKPAKSVNHFLFITNSAADWWNAVERGMQDAAAEVGGTVELRRNDGTVQTQIDLLRQALARPGINGVAISVLEDDAPGVIDALRALRKAGRTVITYDSDVAPQFAEARSAYIGTNNLEAGKTLGQAAAILRPQGGRVAVFVGNAASANAKQRSDGFFAGAGPAFVKTMTWEDQNDFARNLQNVQSALTREGNLGALLGLWAYNAPIIAEELARSPERRKATLVATFDLAEAAIPHLEAGRIDVSAVQNPYEMGYQGVRLMRALIAGDQAAIAEILPDGQSRDTGVRIVVPAADSPVKALGENVITIQEMKSWLASKGLKCS